MLKLRSSKVILCELFGYIKLFKLVRHRMKNDTCSSVICISIWVADVFSGSPHSAGFLEIINYFIHVLATVPSIYSEMKEFLFFILIHLFMSKYQSKWMHNRLF